MTFSSLVHFAEAIMWVIAVFSALIGTGELMLRLSGVRSCGAGLCASIGLAGLIFLGGCLNLVHGIATPVLITIIAMGVVVMVWFRITSAERFWLYPQSTTKTSWQVHLLTFLVFSLLALRLAASVHSTNYQTWDDKHFYLAEPLKTLAAHFFAPDPFSERRITSSLGGCYFLQDLVLAVLPIEDVQLADRGLGLLLLGTIGFEIGQIFVLTHLQSALFVFFALLIPQLTFNQTFVIMPSALFLALAAIAASGRFGNKPLFQAVLLGAVAASITSLKSTYLPHALLFCFCLYFLRIKDRPVPNLLISLAVANLSALVVLGPWMIADHITSGTYLYPLLGKGFHYSAYGLFPPPANFSPRVLITKVIPFTAPMAIVFTLQTCLGWRDKLAWGVGALALSCSIAILAVGAATGGDSVRRYNYPCMIPVLLLLYVSFARAANVDLFASLKKRSLRLCELASAMLLVFTALYIGFNPWTHEYSLMLKALQISLIDVAIEPQEIVREYTLMQNSIPPTGTTLESLEFSFLLNFSSRDFLLADFPGVASLPPGWPARQSGDVLAQYLLAHSVRYLAYTYNAYADKELTDQFLRSKLLDGSVSQWQRSQTLIMLDARRQYRELGFTRHRIFDDGHSYVLDLLHHPPPQERIN